MLRILVVLQVLDFEALDEFERKASLIMADYQGEIVCAFETTRNEDGSGEEIHIVEFHQEEDFRGYTNDPRYQALRDLRDKAISHTGVKVGINGKSYS